MIVLKGNHFARVCSAYDPLFANSVSVSIHENEFSSMDVTLSGISIPVRELQDSKAQSSIVVTLSGIIYDFLLLLRGYRISTVRSLLNKTPSLDE